MNKNIVFAYYHTIFNHGKFNIKTLCKVNLETCEVFDIENAVIPDGATSLTDEYVELLGGERKNVVIDMNNQRLLLAF